MDHIWTIENWEQNIDFMEEGHRTGFRLRFDSGIDPEVRRACKEFAVFLRKEYFFPLRVVAYIKNKKKIRATHWNYPRSGWSVRQQSMRDMC